MTVLAAFHEAGVLADADLHVARCLADIAGESDELAVLAAAFAVRAPRLGHVCSDLTTLSTTVTVETDDSFDVSTLPWPDANEWLATVRASSLSQDGGPLHLEGDLLYLDRYWREERQVANDLLSRASDEAVTDDVDSQARAVETAATRRLTVIAGGPGTGKTTTVAKIIERLRADNANVLIALAAPTGKAAARLQEATNHPASTLHRLLGWKPGNPSRFRHNRWNRLPHDVVIVDETSMVSLTQMARLLEAVRPDARVVLVGDPDQLASVEAGAVLGDIVASDLPNIVTLDRTYRFKGGIAQLAAATKAGDPDKVIDVLSAGHDDVIWLDVDPATASDSELAPIKDAVVEWGTTLTEAALRGDAEAALAALNQFRVLCAHRKGPYGVSTWTAKIESWLADALGPDGPRRGWYPGQPLLFTENDYGLRLFNGDTGVVAQTADGGLRAVFERDGTLLELSPHRLSSVQTVLAMTIHKAQGSQFGEAVFVVPPPASAMLTAELFFTAATRVRRRAVLVGSEHAVHKAVVAKVPRASGVGAALGRAGAFTNA